MTDDDEARDGHELEGSARSTGSVYPAPGRPLSAAARTHLLERCTATLRQRALLIDPERLFALCEALLESGAPDAPSESRLERCIDAAILFACRQDAQRASAEELTHDDYEFLAELFFIPPGREVHSAHAFHQLPLSTRRATIELLLHAKPMPQCLEEGIAEDQERLVARARQGILAIMQIDEAMLVQKPPRRTGKRTTHGGPQESRESKTSGSKGDGSPKHLS